VYHARKQRDHNNYLSRKNKEKRVRLQLDSYEVKVPVVEELNKGICVFRKYEPRDSVYTVAIFIISTFFEIANLWKSAN